MKTEGVLLERRRGRRVVLGGQRRGDREAVLAFEDDVALVGLHPVRAGDFERETEQLRVAAAAVASEDAGRYGEDDFVSNRRGAHELADAVVHSDLVRDVFTWGSKTRRTVKAALPTALV